MSMPRYPLFALFLLRLLVGGIFVAHGLHKIMVMELETVIYQFKTWQIPMPLLTAPLVATVEIAGGVLLFLGVFSRVLATLFGLIMAAAISYAHLGKNFFAKDGMELALILMVCAFVLAIGGPGLATADALKGKGGGKSTSKGKPSGAPKDGGGGGKPAGPPPAAGGGGPPKAG